MFTNVKKRPIMSVNKLSHKVYFIRQLENDHKMSKKDDKMQKYVYKRQKTTYNEHKHTVS